MKARFASCSSLVITLFLAAATAFCQSLETPGARFGVLPIGGRLLGSQLPELQDVGRSFIIGHVKMVAGATLTIFCPDGMDRLIAVDASTRFYGSNGDAVTLQEFKVGEPVAAVGASDNDRFIATKLLKVPAGLNTHLPIRNRIPI